MKIHLKFINLVLVILIIWVGTYLFLASKKPLSFVAKTPVPTIYVAPTRIIIPAPTAVILSSDKLFQLVNEWRVQNGYKAYIYSEFAESVAITRLAEVKKNWSHKGMDIDRFCQKHCYLGENLSKDFLTESETLDAWLNSPGHRENLELPFSHSAIVCDETVENYCVHIFSFF